MKFNYVVAVICLWLAVEIVVGSFYIFLKKFPRKLYDAFGSTWTIIKKNLNVTYRPARYRKGFRRTASLKPTLSTIGRVKQPMSPTKGLFKPERHSLPLWVEKTEWICEVKVPPTTPLSLVSITDTPIPEQAMARRRYVHQIPFLTTRQTPVFWWRTTTKRSEVATSIPIISQIPMDFDNHIHKVRYAFARKNNILYPVKRVN